MAKKDMSVLSEAEQKFVRYINKSSKQRLFEKAVKGVLERNMLSIRGGGCAYRGACGSKCAVGQLMPDEVVLLVDNNGAFMGIKLAPFISKEKSRLLARMHLDHVFSGPGETELVRRWYIRSCIDTANIHGLDAGFLQEVK